MQACGDFVAWRVLLLARSKTTKRIGAAASPSFQESARAHPYESTKKHGVAHADGSYPVSVPTAFESGTLASLSAHSENGRDYGDAE